MFLDISIHAPAKGATRRQGAGHAGSSFQSTLPRRERRASACLLPALHYFNPRSREGSDGLHREPFLGRHISIHAPAKGATQERRLCGVYDGISIHAPAKGATERNHHDSNAIRFQSTLPRRERRRSPELHTHPSDFNPRSREGSDVSCTSDAITSLISIHAPAKGATSASSMTTST